MHLSERDFDFLARIEAVQKGGRLNVEDLAHKLGISPSVLVRRAKLLQDAGWLERRQEATPRGREVYYVPIPRVSVQWTSPYRSVALSWSTRGEVEWDFPLTTQLTDVSAREAIRRFLWELRRQGVLDAEFHHIGNVFEHGPGLAVVVYGSAARGTARADSDIDLLVVLGEWSRTPGGKREEVVLDAAADTSLSIGVPIQAKVIPESSLKKLPREIQRGIREDGLIVFDAIHHEPLWTLVYGERKA